MEFLAQEINKGHRSGGFYGNLYHNINILTCLTYQKHSTLNWCKECFSLDKHLEEVLSGKVFKFNIGRWEKAWSEDR